MARLQTQSAVPATAPFEHVSVTLRRSITRLSKPINLQLSKLGDPGRIKPDDFGTLRAHVLTEANLRQPGSKSELWLKASSGEAA